VTISYSVYAYCIREANNVGLHSIQVQTVEMSNNNNDNRHLDAVAATQVLSVLVANFVDASCQKH